MSMITAVLEADVDGMLHLPLPTELRHGKVSRFWMSDDFNEPLEDFRDYME